MEGGATSPLGIFLLLIAFCCDLINFIPFVGPTISVIIMAILLFLFKDNLKSQPAQNPQEPEENDEKTKEPNAQPDQGNKTEKENEKGKETNKPQAKESSPQNQPASKNVTLAPSKIDSLTQFGKGGLKGMGKKLIRNFLIDLIPVIGPVLASYTVLVWNTLK